MLSVACQLSLLLVITSCATLTSLENANHIPAVLRLRTLSAEGLCPQHAILPQRLRPIYVVVVSGGASASRAYRRPDSEAARQAVTAAALLRRRLLQRAAPGDTLGLVVALRVVHGEVDLDHARAGLYAHLGGRAPCFLAVDAVGMLQDEEAFMRRQGGFDEDVVGGDNRVIIR